MKGKEVADALREKLLARIATLKENNINPKLCIIRVGAKGEDLAYERSARKRMEGLGIELEVKELAEDISEPDFISAFEKVNADESVHGIMVFLPLPKHLRDLDVAGIINPDKDVDGMSPVNVAKVFAGDKSGFAPATAEAVMCMLDHHNIELAGKRVTIVGRSMVVGRPLSMLMLKKNATVKICHTKTADLAAECKSADIVCAAAGKAEMITADMLSDGVIVCDVGINVNEEGKLLGDVEFEGASTKASYISPVPGGVGGVTTSVLAMHVVRAAENNLK